MLEVEDRMLLYKSNLQAFDSIYTLPLHLSEIDVVHKARGCYKSCSDRQDGRFGRLPFLARAQKNWRENNVGSAEGTASGVQVAR